MAISVQGPTVDGPKLLQSYRKEASDTMGAMRGPQGGRETPQCHAEPPRTQTLVCAPLAPSACTAAIRLVNGIFGRHGTFWLANRRKHGQLQLCSRRWAGVGGTSDGCGERAHLQLPMATWLRMRLGRIPQPQTRTLPAAQEA